MYGPVNFTASGGTGAAGKWQIQNGALPAGLVLATDGTLSGTPTEVGTFEFNVRTTDAQPTTVIKPFTLTIVPAPVPLAITNASPLSNATQNSNYQVTFDATGGTGVYVNWAVSAGNAPRGLALDADHRRAVRQADDARRVQLHRARDRRRRRAGDQGVRADGDRRAAAARTAGVHRVAHRHRLRRGQRRPHRDRERAPHEHAAPRARSRHA